MKCLHSLERNIFEWNIWKHHLDLVEKNKQKKELEPGLGKILWDFGNMKSVTRLKGFRDNPGTVEILGTYGKKLFIYLSQIFMS